MSYIYIVIPLGIIGAIVAIIAYQRYRKNQMVKETENAFLDTEPFEFDHDYYQEIEDYFKYMDLKDVVDDITWNDLDMQSVYKQINRSISSVGDEYLYHHLRDQNECDLARITNLSEKISNEKVFRHHIQKGMLEVGRLPQNGFTQQLFEGRKEVPRKLQVIKYQAILAWLPLIVIFINPALAFGTFLGVLMLNTMTYYSLEKTMTLRLRLLNFFVSMIKGARYLEKNTDIEIEGLSSFESIKSYLSVVSVSVNDGTGMAGFTTIINAYFCLYAFSFMRIVNALNRNSEDAQKLFTELGGIEVAYSRASLSQRIEGCIPEFTMDDAPKIVEVCHPLIKNPVSNTYDLKKNMLVTGSNASGKSTFVRSVAINVILGQRLNFCYAQKMSFRKSFVATSMAISDDVTSGDSYFVAEIKSIKRLLEAVSNHDYSLIIIDEILKGTNTIERIAASASILKELETKPCFVCAATHDIELVSILGDGYNNIHFRETVDETGIRFDYLLHTGPSKTRNAIKLLDYYDYDKKLIDLANELADSFTSNRVWKKL